MYEAFDDFLKVPTWHTMHAYDEERFFCALRKMIDNPKFHADSIGEYMDGKRANGENAQANLTQEAFDEAREHYVDAAHAVRGYLNTRCP